VKAELREALLISSSDGPQVVLLLLLPHDSEE
jgi:hypothetical protein